MSIVRIATALSSVLLAACLVDVNYEGVYRCTESNVCPSGLTCDGEFCVSPLAFDAMPGAVDAMPDVISPDAACGDCVPGLLVHWPFDEDDGMTALDLSGAGRSGVVSGAMRINSSHGSGLQFDGTGGAVRRDSDPAFATSDVSLSAWVRVSVLPEGETPRNREVVSYGDLYGLRVGALGIPRVFARTVGMWGGVSGTLRIDDGEWHHLVGQVVGTTIELFVDGSSVAVGDLGGSLYYEDLPLRNLVVGRHGGAEMMYMLGAIDEVRQFSRGLSAAEVGELFSNSN